LIWIIVGVDQVLRGHAEAARGNLLDGRAHRVAVSIGLNRSWFFAAFAGVGLAADRFMAMARFVWLRG
jgi:hypothetical protein